MTTTAEIIAIGDELTSGQRLDTNSQWLSRRLNDIGVQVVLHTTVADDLAAMKSVLCAATKRSPLVISTGGLGPTADDLTRQAISELVNEPLELDQGTLDHIKTLFEKRRRQMSDSNVAQATFPRGSNIIFNEHGTAPGIDLRCQTGELPSRIFALPGVPAELKRMWTEYVAPQIIGELPARLVIRHHAIHCFGAGESEIESRLPDVIRRGRVPQVGITASQATITLRISARAATPEAFQALIAPTVDTIRRNLADLIFGEGNTTLQQVVLERLRQRKQTLSIIDCGLNGLVARMLGELDQNDDASLRGCWILPGDCKQSEMMLAARDLFRSDFVLAIGGVNSSDSNPRRRLSMMGEGTTQTTELDVDCHPDLVPVRSAKQTLNWLRQIL